MRIRLTSPETVIALSVSNHFVGRIHISRTNVCLPWVSQTARAPFAEGTAVNNSTQMGGHRNLLESGLRVVEDKGLG